MLQVSCSPRAGAAVIEISPQREGSRGLHIWALGAGGVPNPAIAARVQQRVELEHSQGACAHTHLRHLGCRWDSPQAPAYSALYFTGPLDDRRRSLLQKFFEVAPTLCGKFGNWWPETLEAIEKVCILRAYEPLKISLLLGEARPPWSFSEDTIHAMAKGYQIRNPSSPEPFRLEWIVHTKGMSEDSLAVRVVDFDAAMNASIAKPLRERIDVIEIEVEGVEAVAVEALAEGWRQRSQGTGKLVLRPPDGFAPKEPLELCRLRGVSAAKTRIRVL